MGHSAVSNTVKLLSAQDNTFMCIAKILLEHFVLVITLIFDDVRFK